MKVEIINTFEREYKYELPLVYKEFLCKYEKTHGDEVGLFYIGR